MMRRRSCAWLSAVWLLACGERESPEPSKTTPATWVDDWRDEVIYEILTDRFDDADLSNDRLDGVDVVAGDLARHQGGDYRGILAHLDYLERLGVTTLWLSPIVDNVARLGDADGYHGYWARDFTRLNPRFGTLEDLQALVDAAHERDMKVMLDVVINHTGSLFDYDLDRDGKLDAGEREPPHSTAPYNVPLTWRFEPPRLFRALADGSVQAFALEAAHFHRRGRIEDWSSASELELGDFPTGLRDLDTSRDDLMRGLVDTYAEWVRRTDVDAFRLDAAPHVSHADWTRFCTGMRERLRAMGKSRFLLLGEVYRGAPDELASYTEPGQLDSVFDFTLKYDGVDHYVLEGGAPSLARAALESARAHYPAAPQRDGSGLAPWSGRVVFGDNHDMARMRGRLDDERAVALALTLLFTVDGIPALYYGTEQGLTGKGGHESREPLWKTGFDESAPTYALIELLTRMRREHDALRHGELIVRYASEHGGLDDAADAGLLAYERVLERERLLVVLNARDDAPGRARMVTGFAEGTELRDLLGSARTFTVRAGGELSVEVTRRAAVVLARLR